MILASGGDPEAVLTLLHVDLSLPKIVHDVYGGFGTIGDRCRRYTRGGSGQCFKHREASLGYPRSRGPSLHLPMGAAAAVSTAAPHFATSPAAPPTLPWLGGTAAQWSYTCALGVFV